jgi:acetylornithine deacetylase/succinyl-diaminopimelate desuccinylase-like protein
VEEHELALETDAVHACSTLIRFDTSNFGGGESRGEREAADWVAAQLSECGYDPVVVESLPGRASTIVRIPGADPELPALLVHGHLDVVPADASEWSVDPFGGEVRDGAVWGRGALDMKGMDAMMLAVARGMARDGMSPPRDLVLAFVADEEDGGRHGAGHIVDSHPELLDGVTTAIGESGGGLVRLPDGGHLYPVATGERGTAWIELTARGQAGHGSRPRADNAVAVLAAAVARLAAIDWPVRVIPAVAALLDGLGERLGVELNPADPDTLTRLGDARDVVDGTLTNSLSATMLQAGYKANVVPSEAIAVLDGRILPGHEDEFLAAVDAALPPSVTRRFVSFQAPVAARHGGAELAAMSAAIRAHDPDALVLPCCATGGTDAKLFSRLGIACYGFAPEWTAPDFDSHRYVHGVDEHIPTDCLAFGVRVLDTYLRSRPTDSLSEEPT